MSLREFLDPLTFSNQVSVAPEAIDELVADLSRHFKNTMSIKLSRPLGNPALLHITLARTLKAYVILRGMEGDFDDISFPDK